MTSLRAVKRGHAAGGDSDSGARPRKRDCQGVCERGPASSAFLCAALFRFPCACIGTHKVRPTDVLVSLLSCLQQGSHRGWQGYRGTQPPWCATAADASCCAEPCLQDLSALCRQELQASWSLCLACPQTLRTAPGGEHFLLLLQEAGPRGAQTEPSGTTTFTQTQQVSSMPATGISMCTAFCPLLNCNRCIWAM